MCSEFVGCPSSPRTTTTSAFRSRHTLLSFERPSAGMVLERAPVRVHLENSIVGIASVLYDQENKGTRWMPWRQEPMKDVGGCDKPGEGADQPMIPGFPNGETYAW